MADVSLDDYIQKKNFTVQIRNVSNTNRNAKSGFVKGRIKFSKQGGNNKRLLQQKFGQTQKNIQIQKQKNGKISLQTKKGQVVSLQTRKNKGLQDKSNIKPISVTVPGANKKLSRFNKGAFDARDRIAAANRPTDARDKLAARAKPSDARMKIQQKKSLEGSADSKIIVTGLGKTLKTINSGVTGSPKITRTLTNDSGGGVQMSGNSLTITRKVNNTIQPETSNQDNGSLNFKITRTLGNQGNRQMSNNPLAITRSINNTPQPQKIQLSSNRGTVIKVANDSYQIPQDPVVEEYYEYDEPEGYHYSQQLPQTHVTEKTLTVKYPQSIRQIPTVVTTKPPRPTPLVAVKRKAPVQERPVKVVSSGPLRLVGGPLALAKPTMVADTVGVVKKPKIVKAAVTPEYVDEVVTYQEPVPALVSPIQGFKVLVSNLHPVVSQDDIIELFGAVGPIKKARLVKDGVAEVLYVNKDDAVKAIQKYHNRELDGIPMQVKMFVPKPAPAPKPAIPSSEEEMAPPRAEPLKLFKGSNKNTPESDIETGTLHRALFKTGITQPSKLVTFTVKI